MPSIVVGGAILRTEAFSCRPYSRSATQAPRAVAYSPAVTDGACPTTVTKSRCPRTLSLSTQNPFSALWYVTRSTSPATFAAFCVKASLMTGGSKGGMMVSQKTHTAIVSRASDYFAGFRGP